MLSHQVETMMSGANTLLLGKHNLGVGGDRTEHVLHRAEAIILPPTVECDVIHCDTNSLGKAKPAIGVASRRKLCGKTPLQVATGLLLFL